MNGLNGKDGVEIDALHANTTENYLHVDTLIDVTSEQYRIPGVESYIIEEEKQP